MEFAADLCKLREELFFMKLLPPKRELVRVFFGKLKREVGFKKKEKSG